jgi:hypothetical protein
MFAQQMSSQASKKINKVSNREFGNYEQNYSSVEMLVRVKWCDFEHLWSQTQWTLKERERETKRDKRKTSWS